MIVGLTLAFNEFNNLVDLVIGYKAALDTFGLAPIDLRKKHVAITGKFLGARLIDNDA